MDKTVVNLQKVRGLGNIVIPKSLSDFENYESSLINDSSVIGGINMPVFELDYVAVPTSIELNGYWIEDEGVFKLLAFVLDKGNHPITKNIQLIFEVRDSNNELVETISGEEEGEVISANYYPKGVGEITILAKVDGIVSNSVSFSDNLIVSTINLSSDKYIVAYNNNNPTSATLRATVLSNNNTPIANQNVSFYNDGTILLGTGNTNNNGVAEYVYTGTGAGDINIIAKVKSKSSEICTIEDCIYHPELLDDSIVKKWNVNNSSAANGVFICKGGCLRDGWDNTNSWQVEFDYKYTTKTLIGLCLCAPSMEEYNDNNRWGLYEWEGYTRLYPACAGDYAVSGFSYLGTGDDNFSSLQNNTWYHVIITKQDPHHITISHVTVNKTHHIEVTSNMLNSQNKVSIGARDNNGGTYGEIQIKNIKVKHVQG